VTTPWYGFQKDTKDGVTMGGESQNRELNVWGLLTESKNEKNFWVEKKRAWGLIQP